MNKKPWQFLMNYGSPKEITLLVYGEIGDDEFWDEVVDKKFVPQGISFKVKLRYNLGRNGNLKRFKDFILDKKTKYYK